VIQDFRCPRCNREIRGSNSRINVVCSPSRSRHKRNAGSIQKLFADMRHKQKSKFGPNCAERETMCSPRDYRSGRFCCGFGRTDQAWVEYGSFEKSDSGRLEFRTARVQDGSSSGQLEFRAARRCLFRNLSPPREASTSIRQVNRPGFKFERLEIPFEQITVTRAFSALFPQFL
jgi:hypothetical protein